ncbi:helix-turn-helix transcriptional regulator [Amycolatopsis cynarae]|uniref:Helix-turn-helix transcriptional regulator n=1 Tax=Amycolatopsis cynarae TaxID=2995223 RepID=A0ABY7BA80_9PSEU|nr:helix-turn-helix transcriptional regulator [Amycolatopsis sp. HUAS 11-8]WAL69274.1 helix-turn-helix transcriptional regulator [Amycolatopsis sp. HUAS 11-8]
MATAAETQARSALPELSAPTAGIRHSTARRRGIPRPRPPETADEPFADEVVQNLVRALVRRVSELVGPDRDGRRPLLDCRELGLRCLLVPVAAPAHEALSPRENEIARMVGLGYTNRAIASVLDISLYTVSAHMRRIFTKLGVGTRAAMVAVLSENPDLCLVPEGDRPGPRDTAAHSPVSA